MPPPAPSAHPLDESGLTAWQAFHTLALVRLTGLTNALKTGDGRRMLELLGWIATDLVDHNLAEERDFLPLLAQADAGDLGRRLAADHVVMVDLTRQWFADVDNGACAATAGRLLDLMRRHLDLEENHMLPLLRARSFSEN
jgi:hypothetical protein